MVQKKTDSGRTLRGVLVNPRLQLKFIALSGGAALVVGGVFFGVVYYFVKENYELLVNLSPMSEEARVQLQKELKLLWATMLLFYFLFSVVCSLVALLYSHKIAGPLYKITKFLENFARHPNDERIKLRPHDELKELAATINKVLDTVEPSANRRSE